MKWLFSFALSLAATNLAEAQTATCTYDMCGGESNVPNKDLVINPEEPQLTCGLVYTTSKFFPADECEMTIKAIETVCCPGSGGSGGSGFSCSLCGSDVAFNEAKALPGTDGITCGALNGQLSPLPTEELCAGGKAQFGTAIDFPAFCECAGAAAPNVCKVCNDDQVVNTTKLIPDGPEEGFTCGDGAAIVSYVADANLCSQFLNSEAQAECCMAKPAGSAGTRVSAIRYLASAFIVALAFAF